MVLKYLWKDTEEMVTLVNFSGKKVKWVGGEQGAEGACTAVKIF